MTLTVRASDIKQYCFCRRTIYFKYVLPIPSLVSYKMTRGKKTQQTLQQKESRRTLTRYGLNEGTREWNVWLSSDALNLTGIMDLLIVGEDGTRYPVEVKETTRAFTPGHKYQLVCYALLLEDQYHCHVRSGFLYSPPRHLLHQKITPNMRQYTLQLCDRVREVMSDERMPPGVRNPGKCRNCEYLRYCRDR